MSKNGLGPYSFGVFLLFVIVSATVPAFAEVTDLEINSDNFFRGDEITFSGTVENGSQGLVTIAINSENDEFVMISQALINSDNSFEKTIKIGDKFTKHGIHDATAFILNMTKGATTEFGVSLNGNPIRMNDSQSIPNDELSSFSNLLEENSQNEISIEELPSSSSAVVGFVDPSKGAQYYIDRYYTESSYQSWFDRNYPGMTIEQAVGQTDNTENQLIFSSSTNDTVYDSSSEFSQDISSSSAVVGFVDPSKGAQYYIDRYYTESSYQSWFDRNYPGMTIEQAVGQTDNTEIQSSVQDLIKSEIIPEAEASSIAEPIREEKNNSEIAQISLAVAGLGILFGAVYGIKRKVDDNSKQISLNRETIRKRFIRPIIGSKPKEILQTRLAKGEITLEEYEKLNAKLN